MKIDYKSLITVVIPSYNRETLIGKTLDSVIAQTHQNWECFVVDDRSTDKTAEVVNTYSEKDPRIHFVQMPTKGNANVSRNKGIELAKGHYIAMLDSDDLWLENHLESRLNCLKASNADGVYGGTIFSSPKSTVTQKSRLQKPDESNFFFATFSMVPKQTSSLFFKTEAIKNVMWDEDLARHQDFDLIIRFLNSHTLTLDENITVNMNVDTSRNSFINSVNKNHDIYLNGCIKYYEKYKNDFFANPYNTTLYLISFIRLVTKKKKWHFAKYYSFELIKLLANTKRLQLVLKARL